MSSISEEEHLRLSFVRDLRITKIFGTEMDCLREISQLDLPVTKLCMVKYVCLRWFLNLNCRFLGINHDQMAEVVDDIGDWKKSATFAFTFRDRPFDLTILDHPAVQKFTIILIFTEGVSVIAAHHDIVPAYLTRRQSTPEDEAFVFELQLELAKIYYDQIFRKILHNSRIEMKNLVNGELHVPDSDPY